MPTPSPSPHSDDRFKRTVKRIAAEAFWLHTYQNAMDGMKGVDAIGLDFFRVSLNAMKDARLIRLIRALEDDSQTASFWYLLKSNERAVTKAAREGGLDLIELEKVSDALVGICNKTFVHIDKDGVFEPQSYYDAAGLTYDQIDRTVRTFWSAMRQLHLDIVGEEIQGDDYDGSDIRKLADLRDKASA
jgi:hypothetical protein